MPYKAKSYGLIPARLLEEYARQLHTAYTNEQKAEKREAEIEKKRKKTLKMKLNLPTKHTDRDSMELTKHTARKGHYTPDCKHTKPWTINV